MKNAVICLLLFGICLTVSAQEKVETVSMRYETQNDMPLFYQKLKESLTYPMAWGNSSIRNFEKWREEARKVLLDCIGKTGVLAAEGHVLKIAGHFDLDFGGQHIPLAVDVHSGGAAVHDFFVLIHPAPPHIRVTTNRRSAMVPRIFTSPARNSWRLKGVASTLPSSQSAASVFPAPIQALRWLSTST